MMYADDSQLYIIMRQSNLATALQDLTLCNQDIMSFFNMLKCNSKKTEIIHFSSLPSSADPVPLLDLFFEIVLPQKRKLDPLESFKYHIHQHRGNKVWTNFDLFALTSSFFIFNPGYNLPFILFYHITRNACFIAFPCMLMQIHLNNNDNNNNNNNNKNWINSAIHNCIPIIKSITLKITDKRFSFSISHDLARWGCGAGGGTPYNGLYGYLFQVSGIWKGRDFLSWILWNVRDICRLGL